MIRSNFYQNCHLCPRHCGVDRTQGERGVCGETAECRVASIGPHFGEEPSFSGTRGSGTIFFSGCSCHCFFCQNGQISGGDCGEAMAMDELERRAADLLDRGVHNLNFVTPDHVWPHVRALCRRLRERGYAQPFLFNCSGYECPERAPEYADVVDVFLPDFKFSDPALAERVMGDRQYPDVALRALERMVAAKGFLHPWDPSGQAPAREGVLVRHLVLPGYVENSLEALKRLHEAFGRLLPLSVMSQYRPTPACADRAPFDRLLKPEEYERVAECVEDLGFEQVYLQKLRDTTDFMPDFRRPEPFEGNIAPAPPSPSD